MEGMSDVAEAKKEIYTYEAGFRIYAMNWSVRPDRPFRMALASFSEHHDNKVRIVQLNDEKGVFEALSEIEHPYPPTNLKWIPDKLGSRPDMFATTADYLRIWRVADDGKVSLRSTLHNVRSAQTHVYPTFCPPNTLVTLIRFGMSLTLHMCNVHRTKRANFVRLLPHSTGTKAIRT